MSAVDYNLAAIRKLISEYAQKYNRVAGSVQLLAASKGQSVEKMAEAFKAGQTTFGENYLQEALEKMAVLSDPTLEWHFIGSVQSNKTHKIAEHFSWVHSVNEMKIAKRLNDQRPLHLAPLNICIEVNISGEKTKSGISIDKVSELAQFCASLPQLKLRGLMAIPEPRNDYAEQRKEFHQLFLLSQTLCAQGLVIDTLSMGMSHDFEAAIAEGATIIRLGTAIFGPRAKR